VHLFVNDNVGQTWKLDADVMARADGGFTYQFQLPNYFVATYAVLATGSVSGQVSASFTDAPNPTVTITNVSKTLLGPLDASTVVTWTADQNGSYSVRVGGTTSCSGTSVASGTYAANTSTNTTVNATSLSEGSNTIRVCVTNTDQNPKTGEATTTITKDTTAPTVTIVSTIPSSLGATGSSTITWNANENGTYKVKVGGSSCSTGGQTIASGQAYSTAPANTTFVVNASDLAGGVNTIRICLTDAATNEGSATTTITKTTIHATTTSITCSPSSVAVTATTVCTATVTDTNTSPTTPTGSVGSWATNVSGGGSFFAHGTTTPAVSSCTLSGSAGVATCQLDFVPALGKEGPQNITAGYGGDGSHSSSNASAFALTVGKASQTVSFTSTAPTAAVVGSTYSPTATGGGSGNPIVFGTTGGNCSISGGIVTMTHAGSCTVTADQAGNTDYTAAPQATQVFTVGKASQTISFGALGDKTFGNADFAVSATGGGSGNDVTFTASGNCEIVDGPKVHLTGAGHCDVTAHQAGNNDYLAAADVTQGFDISKAAQTITLSGVPDSKVYNGTFTPSAVSTSGLDVAITVSGVCSRDTTSGVVTMTSGTGTCTVKANQGGNANYDPAVEASKDVAAVKAAQTITFVAPLGVTFGDADRDLGATASSVLAVSYASSTTANCTIDSTTHKLHVVGAGTCTVTASQAGNDNWLPATDVTKSFAIAKEAQSISFTAPTGVTFGDADFDLGATASSGLAVSYASSTTANCTIDSTTHKLHVVGAGTCTVTASQAGNDNWLPATDVTKSFAIAKRSTTTTSSNATATLGAPSVSLSASVSAIGGSATPNSGLVTFTVKNAASTTVGVPVSGAVAAGSASAVFSLTGVGAGIYSIYASYAGNANFSGSDNNSQNPIGTLTVSYVWTGFFQPVDNLPALNSVKAGQAIPVKFNLAGNQGLNIFFSPTYPTSAPITCGNTASADPIEQTLNAGNSSLTYDTSGNQYVYVWKTDNSWSGQCRTLTLKVVDGSVRQANFYFTK
jgi:hypothetical protein